MADRRRADAERPGGQFKTDGEILYAATQRAFSALEQAVVQIAQARQPPSLTVTRRPGTPGLIPAV
jgi:LysR family glycine cleavage system transcriptional activator